MACGLSPASRNCSGKPGWIPGRSEGSYLSVLGRTLIFPELAAAHSHPIIEIPNTLVLASVQAKPNDCVTGKEVPPGSS